MKFCYWLFVVGLLWSGPLSAQPFTIHNLSLQQGLPEFYVSGLVQDKAGFVWIATRNGLARYDGRRFKIFRHQPRSNRSMASNIILSLQLVSDSTILIHLEDGSFQLLNPITEQFSDLLTPKRLDQAHIGVAQGRLTVNGDQFWGRNGTQLIHFQTKQNQVSVYPLPAIRLPKDVSIGNTFLLDAPTKLYAPYPGGLFAFNTATRQFHQWPHPAIVEHGTIRNFYDTPLARRANGDILVGGVSQLVVFTPHTHRFRSIPIPNTTTDTKVGLIHAGVDGNVYFTHAMTVYRMTSDDHITPLWTAPRIDYHNYFHALLLDRSGVLWIGTNGDGVQQLDLHSLPVRSYPYHTNFVADILSLELGLPTPGWAQSYNIPYRLRFGGSTAYLSARFDDAVYHLFRTNPSERSLRPLLSIQQGQQQLTFNEGNGLRVMPGGTIWMVDIFQGLIKADTSGRVLNVFALPNDKVSDIQPLGNWIWIGSEFNGLYAYDPQARRIVRHLRYQPTDSTTLISDHIWCLAADPQDASVLWVGTQEGLCRLDTRTMHCRAWTEKEGLPSATINTLLTDRRGQLWFSTLNGISRLEPRSGRLRHFTTADGLLDIEYKPFLGTQLPDGRLAFGGLTGLTVFDPLALKDATPQPVPTVLTTLRIANVPVEPGQPGSPLALPLNATATLYLTYKQNFLTFEYAGLQYNKPASLQYRYQLTGVDEAWVYAGRQNVAQYTQLAPGEYTFRVNAADADGHWSHVVKTIRIIIAPPWWQTWWAYGLYGLLMVVLVRAYIQYRINQTQLQKEVALKEQEARLVQENADWQTRFFTNITHEFRTPLTLIINPLERLMETAAPALQQPLGVMHRNAQRLLRLINQLLDIAKLEAGQLAITQSQGNIPAFVAGLVDAFRPRADKKGVELTYESSGLTADYRFDAHKLESIGYNLLSNALKFTPSGGQIGVRLTEERSGDAPSEFQLQVSDTGVGIAPEQLNHIFDRFYQGRQVEGSLGTGTGIGLFLVAEFSRLLGGTVTVESQLGQGTRFIVTLPLEQADPAPPLVETIPAPPVLYAEEAPKPFVAPATAPLVLVVEDNDELREFIAGQLVGTYRIITATNGQEGWEICLNELPELVISDVMMPLMDGFTLVERIKTTPLTAHIAVILLTAKTMTESRIQGLSVGANDYLTKPFNVQELQLRISNLLRHQQQLRQHWQQRMNQIDEGEHPTPLTSPPITDPFLDKLYQLLDKQVANPAFTIEQLADDLAVSPRTLRRKVATVTGSNAVELLRSYRLQKAATLLREGVSVSDAAEQTGFESVPYFSRSFKAQFAISPSAYGPTRPRA